MFFDINIRRYFTGYISVLAFLIAITCLSPSITFAVDYTGNSIQTKLRDYWGTLYLPCSTADKDRPGDEGLTTKYLNGDGTNDPLFKTICVVSNNNQKVGDVIDNKTYSGYTANGDDNILNEINPLGDKFTIGTITSTEGSGKCFGGGAKGPDGTIKCVNISSNNKLANNFKYQYLMTGGGKAGSDKQTCLSKDESPPISPGSLCLLITRPGPETVNGVTYYKTGEDYDPNGLCLQNMQCYKAGITASVSPVPSVMISPPASDIQGECYVNVKSGNQISIPLSAGRCVAKNNTEGSCYESASTGGANPTIQTINGCNSSTPICCDIAAVPLPTLPPPDPFAGQPYHECRKVRLVDTTELKTMIDSLPEGTGFLGIKDPLSLPGIIKGIATGSYELLTGVNKAVQAGTDIMLQDTLGANMPYDSYSNKVKDDQEKKLGQSKIFEYFMGCEGDNICASSRNLSLYTDDNELVGEDVCIPNDDFAYYTIMLKKEKNKPNASKPNDATPVQATTVVDPAKLIINRNLALMCFKQIPYATTVEMAYSGKESIRTVFDWVENNVTSPNDVIPRLDETTKLGGIYGFISDSIIKNGSIPIIGAYIPVTQYFMYIREHFITGEIDPWFKDNCSDPSEAHCSLLGTSPTPKMGDIIDKIPFKNFVSYSNIPETPESKRNISQMKKQLITCLDCARNSEISTAIGCLPVDNLGKFITEVCYTIMMGIAGAYCVLCMIIGAVRFQTSRGNSAEIEKAQKQIVQCLLGMLLIIFSIFILRVLGVAILRIPGFN